MDAVHKELENQLLDIDINNIGKLKNICKLRAYIKELAVSNNVEFLNFLATLISKYIGKISDSRKEGMFVFHYSNKSDVFHKLNLDEAVEVLYNANTPFKNELLYKLADKHIELIDYKIKTAVRMFSPDYVFENYSQYFISYPDLAQVLKQAYKIDEREINNDNDRNWDKRWAAFFLQNNKGVWAISVAFPFIYDSDIEAWSELLAVCEIPKRESYSNQHQFVQDCVFYRNLLAIAYKNKHPESDFYYNKFLNQGFPENLLNKR